MSQRTDTIESIIRDLAERAKELNCLYTIDSLTSDDQSPLEKIFQKVLEVIPMGWQYPGTCHARIVYDGRVVETPNYCDSPWTQTAPIRVMGEVVGRVDVCYAEEMPLADIGPFLHEEQKLITTIADRLGHAILHRKLVEARQEWRQVQKVLSKPRPNEWLVILELLRRTDQSLLMRITRKMINHMCWSGIKEADQLLRYFGINSSAERQDLFQEANQPRGASEMPSDNELVEEVFRIAAERLNHDEIVACIHKWIKQDRAGFLVNALENHNTSLSEVGDAINRYQHATHGDMELSSPVRKGLRVSMVRRFLSDQMEFITVAKDYVNIKDFHDLFHRMIFPARGHGKIGGKGAGLFLANQILRRHSTEDPDLAAVRTPRTWYITSDGLHDFIYCNHLEDVFMHKYKEINEIRQEYPDIIQVFKHSHFSNDIIKGLSMALDEFGERPLIVRSSSLLEDRFGAAFSGKYKSLFISNQGSKQTRLRALLDAIAEVYASTFGPDPIEYRAERNLLDFQEGMGIMIQEVVGARVGHYFLPALAGVAFSNNEFRWSPRIKREDGLVRLVPGLGTRAVDRLSDDYPTLVSPGQPGLRANATTDEMIRYSPKYLDVINLETQQFETVQVSEFFREWGQDMPALEQIVSVLEHGHLRTPMLGQIDFERDDLVVTFEGLLTRTPFLKQIRSVLALLQDRLHTPVDIEFAYDGKDLYLLQCRAQNPSKLSTPAPIPRDLPRERLIFSANRYISNGSVPNITHVVYVDPDEYAQLGSLEDLAAVGRAVGSLNKLLPKRQFILMGPGRWGSRGDIKLGVRVTYSDINNTAMLVEIARKKGDYTPDLSFGTHFFQDLVEASIRYLPLYPDDEGVVFNERFLRQTRNVLADLAPEYARLAHVVRVIDVPSVAEGQVLQVLMNADLDEAVGLLVPPATIVDSVDQVTTATEPQREQCWRWRQRMAEHIAARLDPNRFGVAGLYIFGSTKNATAGPASDIDLLVHFRGTPEQRRELERWLEGWSLCLSEMNYLRTGYRTDGLLDVHLVTDEDVAKQTPFAAKINAVTDAARPLPMNRRPES